MKRLLSLLAIILVGAAPVGRPTTYLASITGIQLGPKEYIDAFSIDTWGVDFLAVCKIPPGWTIKAGREASPDGVIVGEASHGVTFINRSRLASLNGLVLIRIDGEVRPRDIPLKTADGVIPATFKGKVSVGTYANTPAVRDVKLNSANVRLVPAARCPAPS